MMMSAKDGKTRCPGCFVNRIAVALDVDSLPLRGTSFGKEEYNAGAPICLGGFMLLILWYCL